MPGLFVHECSCSGTEAGDSVVDEVFCSPPSRRKTSTPLKRPPRLALADLTNRPAMARPSCAGSISHLSPINRKRSRSSSLDLSAVSSAGSAHSAQSAHSGSSFWKRCKLDQLDQDARRLAAVPVEVRSCRRVHSSSLVEASFTNHVHVEEIVTVSPSLSLSGALGGRGE